MIKIPEYIEKNPGSVVCTNRRGFTMIETLIAITLLMLAVVEPMSLTVQALKSAYYARDQITASNLAQEAVEAVRAARDSQILKMAEDPEFSTDIFGMIPVDQDFIIDTSNNNTMTPCSGACPPLQTDGVLYGYNVGWVNTTFTRIVHACYVQSGGGCSATPSDEIRLQVTVDWRTSAYPARSLVMYENLYRWVSNS